MTLRIYGNTKFTGNLNLRTIIPPLSLDGINLYTFDDSLTRVSHIDGDLFNFTGDHVYNFQLVTYNSAQYLIRYSYDGSVNPVQTIYIHEIDSVSNLPNYTYIPKYYAIRSSAFATVWLDFNKGKGIAFSQSNSEFTYFTFNGMDLSQLNIVAEVSGLGVTVSGGRRRIEVTPDEAALYIFTSKGSPSDQSHTIWKFQITSAHDTSPVFVNSLALPVNSAPSYYFTSPDGTQLFAAKNYVRYYMYKYNVSPPYHYENLTFLSSIQVNTSATNSQAFFFSQDGSKFGFWLHYYMKDVIYDISNPWTLSGWTLSQQIPSSAFAFILYGTGKYQDFIYSVRSGGLLVKCKFDTPYDFNTFRKVDETVISGAGGLNHTNFRNMTFTPSGDKILIADNSNQIHEIQLTGPGDITSATLVTSHSVPLPGELLSTIINSSGDKMIHYWLYSSNYYFSEYSLSTPWDMRTATEVTSAIPLNSLYPNINGAFGDQLFAMFDEYDPSVLKMLVSTTLNEQARFISIKHTAPYTLTPATGQSVSPLVNIPNFYYYSTEGGLMLQLSNVEYLISENPPSGAVNAVVKTRNSPFESPYLEADGYVTLPPVFSNNYIHYILAKPDGSEIYAFDSTFDNIYVFNTSDPYTFNDSTVTLSTISFSNFGFSAATIFTAFDFSWDGQYCYIGVDSGTYYTIYQYQCSTPWSVDGMTLYKVSPSAPQYDTFKLSPSGNYIYGRSNEFLYRFPLSTPWDISTANFGTALQSTYGAFYRYQGDGGLEIDPSAKRFFTCYDSLGFWAILVVDLQSPDDITNVSTSRWLVPNEPGGTNDLHNVSIIRTGPQQGKRMYVSNTRLGRIYTFKGLW